MDIFFYGLFMDEALLAEKGIAPGNVAVGHVDGFALRIGERATLLRSPGSRAYGVMMTITRDEAQALYSERSVADYLPATVTVELLDGRRVAATCYNLPGDKVAGGNEAYAEALWELASRLDLPELYLDEIRQAGSGQR
jgi:hypothetical protein